MTNEQEMKMLEKLEEARKASEKGCTVYAMSNGNDIEWFETYTEREMEYAMELEEQGYWICSIFENGHMVDL